MIFLSHLGSFHNYNCFPIIFIEDVMSKDDRSDLQLLTKRLGDRAQL
ncbi:hypothetical protein [Candidatus Ichthyocystis sparus]|nr:hypothetical protein [Candidatus Ichthyocystis sparus]